MQVFIMISKFMKSYTIEFYLHSNKSRKTYSFFTFQDLAYASSRLDNHYPWYAIDNIMSRNDESNFFATHYQVAPYFMLEFSSLTKLLGVAIISRDELKSDVTYDILNTDDSSITN